MTRTVLAALLACAAVTVTVPAQAAAPADREMDVALHQAVAELSLATEDRSGYNRETSFGGWTDDDPTPATKSSRTKPSPPPTITGKCTLTGGTWFSWYDNTTIEGARGLDIDHMVSVTWHRRMK
ncbi:MULTISPECIES: hypothetical protein [unclassified Streptomyces]|uniref:hypothetical protein n=1 Tax=unclassified Streptomyces TaxID=2593676 RepID=UPI00114D2C6A|nr:MULTISPECIES: hypothetical protein [unclassified Streptomyces]MYS20211.1 hypothetical protein [Streptomyces sp. SID4948]